MSNLDPSAPAPDPDFMIAMFAELGIPRLAEHLEAGDLSPLGDSAVSQYCKLAAVWECPPIPFGEEVTTREQVAEHFAALLVQVLSGEGPDYSEIHGEPYVMIGECRRHVSSGLLAHFQACWKLLSDEGTARAFLALAPQEHRDPALARAGELWNLEFAELIERLQGQ
ncbi:MAG: hypothetical protein J2P58_00170 [Acidimicrobiaceae bacterium]|nr:hypothetical protein [Acidimicrobiaceae bacterium]